MTPTRKTKAIPPSRWSPIGSRDKPQETSCRGMPESPNTAVRQPLPDQTSQYYVAIVHHSCSVLISGISGHKNRDAVLPSLNASPVKSSLMSPPSPSPLLPTAPCTNWKKKQRKKQSEVFSDDHNSFKKICPPLQHWGVLSRNLGCYSNPSPA